MEEANNNKEKEIKPNENHAQHNVVVETYTGDMAGALQGDSEAGLVKKVIHRQEEYEEEEKRLSPESRRNKFFLSFGTFLLFGAVILAGYFFLTSKSDTVMVARPFTSMIYTDKNTFLEVSGLKKDKIYAAVSNEINQSSIKPGGVEGIYLTENKQVIGLRQFITLINSAFYPGANKLIVSDDFMMGFFKNQAASDTSQNNPNGFFLLIKMQSISDIFSLMRAWENNMLSELHGFTGLDLNSSTNYLFTQNFQDGLIQNKNARILYDNKGNIVLMYVYVDDTHVLVTDSEAAADEIIMRLSSNTTQ